MIFYDRWAAETNSFLLGYCYKLVNSTSNMTSGDMFWIVNDDFYIRVYALLQLIIGILTVVGNIVVVLYVYSEPKRRRKFHKYTKASLAVADIFFGVTIIASSVIEILIPCHKSSTLFRFLLGMFLVLSYFHLTFMSLYRCHAVKCPENHASITKKKFFTGLVAVWIVSVLLNIIVVICHFFNNGKSDDFAGLYLLRMILFTAVPYLITVVSTLCLLFSWRNRKQASYGQSRQWTQTNHDENVSLIKTICFVVLGYSITCIPNIIFSIQISIEIMRFQRCCPYSIRHNFQTTLMMTNGLVDIIVYNFNDNKFRQYLKRKLYSTDISSS